MIADEVTLYNARNAHFHQGYVLIQILLHQSITLGPWQSATLAGSHPVSLPKQ